MAQPEDSLAVSLQKKLSRWGQLGQAPEYYALRNRGPSRPTVVNDLNRFGGNMGPYVDAVLPLQSVEYINASAIDNLGRETPPFVATMCPKKSTFSHFWSMVWEMGSTTIVNLTNEKDRVGSGTNDKREQYWPPFEDADIQAAAGSWPVEPLLLGCDLCEQVPTLRRYAVELLGPQPRGEGRRPRRLVALYWYARWVDFPSSSSIGSRAFYTNAWHVLQLAEHVAAELRLKAERAPAERWAVCHCSAGVGRTGTFIALVHILKKLPKLSAEADFDDAAAFVIEAMRERRLWMVKTDIEFATLYAAALLRRRNAAADERIDSLSWEATSGDSSPLLGALEALRAAPDAAHEAAESRAPRRRPAAGDGVDEDREEAMAEAVDNDVDVSQYKGVGIK